METFATIISAIAVIAAVAYLLLKPLLTKKTNSAADAAELLVQQELLETALFDIVTECEREYGDGTGQFKLAKAIRLAALLVPEKWKNYFDTNTLSHMVDSALEFAKTKWLINPALIGKDPA